MSFRVRFSCPDRCVSGQSAAIDSRVRAEGMVRRLRLKGWEAAVVPSDEQEADREVP